MAKQTKKEAERMAASEAMAEPVEPTAADQVITSINALPEEGKRELAMKVRTTKEGIQAYMTLNFGMA